MSREPVDLSVLPIDVGFDLRVQGIAVHVPAATRSIAYDVSGTESVVRGTHREIVAALTAAGYTVAAPPGVLECLTPGELAVAELLILGRTNDEIASVLKIGMSTVYNHRSRAMRKLGCRNDVEIMLKVQEDAGPPPRIELAEIHARLADTERRLVAMTEVAAHATRDLLAIIERTQALEQQLREILQPATSIGTEERDPVVLARIAVAALEERRRIAITCARAHAGHLALEVSRLTADVASGHGEVQWTPYTSSGGGS